MMVDTERGLPKPEHGGNDFIQQPFIPAEHTFQAVKASDQGWDGALGSGQGGAKDLWQKEQSGQNTKLSEDIRVYQNGVDYL